MNENKKKVSFTSKLKKNGSKYGSAMVVMTIIAVAVVILLNLIVGRLPATIKQIDLSDNRIYTISDVSKEFAKTVDDNIHLIMLEDSSTVDSRITKFVQNYASLSSNFTYEKIDTLSHPSILEEYDCSTGTLIVENMDTGKYKEIFYKGSENALIRQTLDMESFEYVDTAFDAEGQVTSAIQYVTGDNSHNVYALTGHGESALPATASNLLNKTNIVINENGLDIMKSGSIPEDCELIISYNPMTDLTPDELTVILEYMDNGGKVVLFLGSQSLENFNSLLLTYGFEMQTGYIGDMSTYVPQYSINYGYQCFYGDVIKSHEIGMGISEDVAVLLPSGMSIVEPARTTITTGSFLSTNVDGGGIRYADSSSYVEGTYVLGGLATEGEARLTVFSASTIVEETIITNFSNAGNLQVFLNAMTSNFDDSSSVAIEERTLSVSTVTFDDYELWVVIYPVLLPVVIIVFGLIFWGKRRKR